MANFELGNLVWKVTGDTAGFESNLKKANKTATTFGGSLKKALAAGTIALAVKKVGELGLSLLRAGSDAEETRQKFNVVFKDVGSQAAVSAKDLADNYGLATQKSQELLSNTADLLQGFGISSSKSLELSTNVAKLGADLASFSNFSGGAQGATEALSAALLGENERVKALGISITQAGLKDLAEEQGLVFEALDKGERALLTYTLAVRQSQNAIGDFQRSQESFANQTRIAQAKIDDLKASLGEALLPIATDAIGIFQGFADGLTTLAENFAALPDPVRNTILVLLGGAGLVPALIKVGSVLKATVLPLLLSPVGLIVALGALAGALVAAGIQSKSFDNKLKKQAKSLELINKTIDKARALKTQADDAKTLIDRYEELNGISNRTAAEQEELSSVVAKLGKDLPGAATAWDEYGVAVSLNADKANEAVQDILKSRQALLNASRAALQAQKVQAEQTKSEIQSDLAQARRNRDEATLALQQSQAFSLESSQLLADIEFGVAVKDQETYNKAVNAAIDSLVDFNQITKEEAEELKELGQGGQFVTRILTDVEAATADLGREQQKAIEKADKLEETWEEAEKIGLDLATTEAELNAINKQLAESSGDVAAAADIQTQSWKNFIAEILDTGGNSGAEFVNNFLQGFENNRTVLKQIADSIGEDLDLTEILGKEADAIRKALEELLSIPADVIDEPFTIADESIQILINRLKELTQTEEETAAASSEILDGQLATITEYAEGAAGEFTGLDELRKRQEEEALEAFQDAYSEREDIISQFAGAVTNIFDELARNQELRIDNEEARQIAALDNRVLTTEEREEAIKNIEEKADRRRLAAKRKKAEQDKVFALFDIAIGTATAVVQNLGVPPVAIAIGVLGAIEAAVVAARPVPNFEKGGVVPRFPGVPMTGDKQPAMLNPGEEVITRDDPRHQYNGGGGVTIIQNNTLNTDTLAGLQRAARILKPELDREGLRIG